MWIPLCCPCEVYSVYTLSAHLVVFVWSREQTTMLADTVTNMRCCLVRMNVLSSVPHARILITVHISPLGITEPDSVTVAKSAF